MPKDNLTMNTKTNPASLESVKNPKIPKAVMKTPPAPKKSVGMAPKAADKVVTSNSAPGSSFGAGRKLGNHFSNS
jgi:hypothetical protein